MTLQTMPYCLPACALNCDAIRLLFFANLEDNSLTYIKPYSQLFCRANPRRLKVVRPASSDGYHAAGFSV